MAGILALAVVIGLCLVALVVLFDRFTAKPARDCAESRCRPTPTSGSSSPITGRRAASAVPVFGVGG